MTAATILLPQHAALISASAIALAVANARGYRSIEDCAELEPLGFAPAQRRVPALLVPVYGVRGGVAPVTYQLRPDAPRKRSGKPLKYETPSGSGMVLDVPRAAHAQLADPSIPLWITEGARKADAAVSVGLCCVALLGVWNWRGSNSEGGKTALADWESVALNGRRVLIAFDSDVMDKPPVHKALARLKDFLARRGANVRMTYLPAGAGGAKVGLDDYLAAGGTVDALVAGATDRLRRRQTPDPAPASPTAAEPAPATKDLRPEISIGPDIQAMADVLERIVVERADLHVYQQAGRLIEPCRDGKRAKEGRPEDAPLIIRDILFPRLFELASNIAVWLHHTETESKVTRPDKDAVRALLARPLSRLRYLRGVTSSPCLRPDGSVLSAIGYDSVSGLLMIDAHTDYPSVPSDASESDARGSLEEVRAVIADFPFVSASDRSSALAAIMTLLARHAIDGAVPLFLVRSPTPGTGKSLLVDVISILATGVEAPRYSQPEDSDEFRKLLFAIARDGDPLVLIDNVARALGAQALDAAITGRTISGRLLGSNETRKIPFPQVLFATGNNIQVRGDLVRRAIPIDLDAGAEQPETRAGFKIPHILAHVRKHRPRLVVAVLTILAAYRSACDQPPDVEPYGGFEAWSRVVREPLVWLGEADPCLGRARLRQDADPELEALKIALRAWRAAFGVEPQTIADAIVNPAVKNALCALDPKLNPDRPDVRRLGYAFRRFKGRVVGGLKLHGSPYPFGVRWQALDSNVRVTIGGDGMVMDEGITIAGNAEADLF